MLSAMATAQVNITHSIYKINSQCWTYWQHFLAYDRLPLKPFAEANACSLCIYILIFLLYEQFHRHWAPKFIQFFQYSSTIINISDKVRPNTFNVENREFRVWFRRCGLKEFESCQRPSSTIPMCGGRRVEVEWYIRSFTGQHGDQTRDLSFTGWSIAHFVQMRGFFGQTNSSTPFRQHEIECLKQHVIFHRM